MEYSYKFTNVNWYSSVEFCITLFGEETLMNTVVLDMDVEEEKGLDLTHEKLTDSEEALTRLVTLMEEIIKTMNHLNDNERQMRDLNGIYGFYKYYRSY